MEIRICCERCHEPYENGVIHALECKAMPKTPSVEERITAAIKAERSRVVSELRETAEWIRKHRGPVTLDDTLTAIANGLEYGDE